MVTLAFLRGPRWSSDVNRWSNTYSHHHFPYHIRCSVRMCYPFHFHFWSDMNCLHRIPFTLSLRWCFMLILRHSKWITVIRIHFNRCHCRKSMSRQQPKWHFRCCCCIRSPFGSILEDITPTSNMLRDDAMIEAECHFEGFILFHFWFFPILHGNGTPGFWWISSIEVITVMVLEIKAEIGGSQQSLERGLCKMWQRCRDQNVRVWLTILNVFSDQNTSKKTL